MAAAQLARLLAKNGYRTDGVVARRRARAGAVRLTELRLIEVRFDAVRPSARLSRDQAYSSSRKPTFSPTCQCATSLPSI